MSDIVQRLRDSATQARALDRSVLLNEAADEIERLRSYEQSDEKRCNSDTSGFTLTDAERTEIRRLIEDYEQDGEPASQRCVDTLRGLLERTE